VNRGQLIGNDVTNDRVAVGIAGSRAETQWRSVFWRPARREIAVLGWGLLTKRLGDEAAGFSFRLLFHLRRDCFVLAVDASSQ
jgi:hypothetical protein